MIFPEVINLFCDTTNRHITFIIDIIVKKHEIFCENLPIDSNFLHILYLYTKVWGMER